jgi:SnoaL-like domain
VPHSRRTRPDPCPAPRACDQSGSGGTKATADVPADLVSAYYEILQAGAGSYDPERLRCILAPDLEFDGPIAGRIRGADRFSRGVAGFIETQHGIRFLQQVVTHDAAAVLYDADLPGGTLRFAEFFRFDGGQIASIKLLYDPAQYTEFGRR